MNNSEYVGKLDTQNKEDIIAMEEALKAKYENNNSNKPTD
jgi:hypothetical protein